MCGHCTMQAEGLLPTLPLLNVIFFFLFPLKMIQISISVRQLHRKCRGAPPTLCCFQQAFDSVPQHRHSLTAALQEFCFQSVLGRKISEQIAIKKSNKPKFSQQSPKLPFRQEPITRLWCELVST